MVKHEFKLLNSNGSIPVASIFFIEKEDCRGKIGIQTYDGALKAVEIHSDFIYKDLYIYIYLFALDCT